MSCAEGEKKGENLKIETVEHDSSCGEYGEDLCLPSSNVKEENAMVSIRGTRQDVLTTVSELRFPKDKEEELDEGSLHKFPSEVLTKGHTVSVARERKDKITEDVESSDYLLYSTKHKDTETCYGFSQDHLFVVQGMKPFCKLSKEYTSCKKF